MCFFNNTQIRGRLQFGQIFSVLLTTKPQFAQVAGWTSPRGAPHARQREEAMGLAVWQYGQTVRLSRSESCFPVPC